MEKIFSEVELMEHLNKKNNKLTGLKLFKFSVN